MYFQNIGILVAVVFMLSLSDVFTAVAPTHIISPAFICILGHCHTKPQHIGGGAPGLGYKCMAYSKAAEQSGQEIITSTVNGINPKFFRVKPGKHDTCL